ncbi:MAG TPA: hypothetical protein VJS69_09545 [Candidatus Krumholzibacteria bacterium]|nr:hypothetical protein [Candidatus Krumholzibacteria bacterium]
MRINLLCIAMLIVNTTIAAATEHPERQVTFMVDSGGLALPLLVYSAPLDSVAVHVSGLEATLELHSVVTVGRLFPDFSPEDTTAVAWSGESVRLTDFSQFWYAEVPQVDDVQALIDALEQIPGVAYVGRRVSSVVPTSLPNDPDFYWQWGLRNTGQVSGYVSGEDINWLPAWQISNGGPVKVGLYGQGVKNHTELLGRVYQPEGSNQSLHETRIACIIAAATNTTPPLGIAGINGQAQIYSRIADSRERKTEVCSRNDGAELMNKVRRYRRVSISSS